MSDTSKSSYRVVIIEDNHLDLKLLKIHLQNVPDVHFEIESYENVQSVKSNAQFIQNSDVILADMGLPDSSGLDVVDALLEITTEVPIVIITGHSYDDFGMSALKRGAQDILIKDDLTPKLLFKTIKYSMERMKVNGKLKKVISLNKELERFAFVASHDLQEPLRTISNFGGLLEKKIETKEYEEATTYVKFITDAAKRLSSQITSLLEYSRIGASKKVTKLNTNGIIKEVVHDLDSLIQEKEVSLVIENVPDVIGREDEIRLLIQNLVSNAIKFGTRDKENTITIKGKKEKDQIYISVVDQGIGIEKEKIPKIFEVFYRLNHYDDFPGTGIGLAHCKKIVELHGGQIHVESNINQGSTFTFSLPTL